MTTSDLMGARFAQPAYRRVRLADEPAARPLSARKLLRIALAFVGVVLLVASAVAFVQLVSQGWLELPSTAALGVGGAAPAPTAPAAVTKALLYPLAAVLSFVMSGLLTTRGR